MKRRKPQIIDREATAAAGFLDKRSYIRKGKRFLFGLDMRRLRIIVFERSRGFCEQRIRGVLGGQCNRNISWETMELDHQPSLAQGGDDSLNGVVASCRRCHRKRHNREPQFGASRKVGA